MSLCVNHDVLQVILMYKKDNKTSLNSNADTKGSGWENVNWIQIAHYRVCWLAFMNMVHNLWVP